MPCMQASESDASSDSSDDSDAEQLCVCKQPCTDQDARFMMYASVPVPMCSLPPPHRFAAAAINAIFGSTATVSVSQRRFVVRITFILCFFCLALISIMLDRTPKGLRVITAKSALVFIL